ncbi:MAG: DUF3644 domain-containing protein [Chloroflexi bacterium]|nr:DUF3644 domain-containing protein [Chloroflexota bacterium]
MSTRQVWSVRAELLAKSREAALNAVQTFNNPLATFKTETFIVLIVIAWTYLLHSYYRRIGIDYRYFDEGPKRRKFHRTKAGEFKHWELERCLNEKSCPLDAPTKSNLRFLFGLRHEIEHHRSAGIDEQLTGRYLACCLNYERTICKLFGPRYSLGSETAFALQFRDLTAIPEATEASRPLPANVARYVQQFDASLPLDEFQSPSFSYRILFTRKLTNKPGQADRAIEFIAPDSNEAQTLDNERWVLKEVERPKHLPGDIVKLMHKEGYPRFSMHYHTVLWKSLKAKDPGRGYGYQVVRTWYWYNRWIDEVRKHCAVNIGLYGPSAGSKASA